VAGVGEAVHVGSGQAPAQQGLGCRGDDAIGTGLHQQNGGAAGPTGGQAVAGGQPGQVVAQPLTGQGAHRRVGQPGGEQGHRIGGGHPGQEGGQHRLGAGGGAGLLGAVRQGGVHAGEGRAPGPAGAALGHEPPEAG